MNHQTARKRLFCMRPNDWHAFFVKLSVWSSAWDSCSECSFLVARLLEAPLCHCFLTQVQSSKRCIHHLSISCCLLGLRQCQKQRSRRVRRGPTWQCWRTRKWPRLLWLQARTRLLAPNKSHWTSKPKCWQRAMLWSKSMMTIAVVSTLSEQTRTLCAADSSTTPGLPWRCLESRRWWGNLHQETATASDSTRWSRPRGWRGTQRMQGLWMQQWS